MTNRKNLAIIIRCDVTMKVLNSYDVISEEEIHGRNRTE